MPIWDTLTAVLIGFTLGLAFFFIINTKGYASIFTPEQTLLGLQDRDTLYHAALAAMLAKYGVPSTGLDGLPLERFHFLSHAWIGLMARWMDVTPTHAYYLAQQIVCIPLLFFSLSTAAYWVWRPERLNASGVITVTIPIALVLLFQRWDWARYLTSESYCLSLILLLLTLPLLTETVERPQITCCIARYMALGVALIGMLYTKTPVGVIFSMGLFYALIRKHGLTPAQYGEIRYSNYYHCVSCGDHNGPTVSRFFIDYRSIAFSFHLPGCCLAEHHRDRAYPRRGCGCLGDVEESKEPSHRDACRPYAGEHCRRAFAAHSVWSGVLFYQCWRLDRNRLCCRRGALPCTLGA